MARAKNSVESVQVTMSVTKQVRAYLELLTAQGLSGKNAADTGAQLISDRIKVLVNEGSLPKPSNLVIDSDSDD